MAAALMTTAGTACAINTLRWFGMSDSGQMEYSEVSCADNNGYLLETPRVGPSAQTSVVSCQDAAKRGLKCRLTAVGSASTQVTMQMFRDAIKQNGLACEPTKMRVIGRESVDKRYVVELQCAQQTDGLVAFIPLEGNTNKFETLDCAAAAGRDIVCQLTGR